MERIERYRGCLLGLAVGDAPGLPVGSRQPRGWSAGGRTTSNPASGRTIPHSRSVVPRI
ncbi:hypothetical protein [Methanoculleus sp.]|uniref:hypothetical protein n=1 Tax=Methanoculleus sp. TaxID=90427 RepID=UPI0026044E74|nr:hypothetical protein [Methanoculleus sp.]MDI6866685.1 hypothetical protein [Methanoculleus sp.]